MKEGFDQINKKFDQIDCRFDKIDKRFDEVDEKFVQIDNRFDQVDKNINTLAVQVSENTRTFEIVTKDIEIIKTKIGRAIDSRFERLEDRVLKLEQE